MSKNIRTIPLVSGLRDNINRSIAISIALILSSKIFADNRTLFNATLVVAFIYSIISFLLLLRHLDFKKSKKDSKIKWKNIGIILAGILPFVFIIYFVLGG